MEIQLTSGGVYEVEKHRLDGKRVQTRYYGEGEVIGIRAGCDARTRNAFIVKIGERTFLMSRANFSLIDKPGASPAGGMDDEHSNIRTGMVPAVR